MLKLVQILLLSLQWLQSNGDPLLFQGFSIRKSFDISLEPLPIKPLTFIREKWTPFGLFRKTHTTQKRDLSNTASEDIFQGSESIPIGLFIKKQSSLVVPHKVEGSLFYPENLIPASVPLPDVPLVTVPLAPVSEEIEPVTVAPLYFHPFQPPLVELVPENIPPQDAISPLFMTTIFEQPVDLVSPPIVPQIVPAVVVPPSPPVLKIISSEQVPLPPIPLQPVPAAEQPVVIAPVVAPPLPSVPIIVPPEAAAATPPQMVPLIVQTPSIPGSVILPSRPILSTGTVDDMIPVAIPPSINTVPLENKSPGILSKIFKVAPGLRNTQFHKKISPLIESNSIDESANQNESFFIRGSKKALHLGNVFLQVMSDFVSTARVTLDRLTSPPPPMYLN